MAKRQKPAANARKTASLSLQKAADIALRSFLEEARLKRPENPLPANFPEWELVELFFHSHLQDH
jgi:hypothetical protein